MRQPQHLEYIFNHVFLPPRLPQEDDADDDASSVLVETFTESLRHFWQFCDEAELQGLERCIDMLIKLRQSQDTKDPAVLAEYMWRLRVGDYLALHIKAQNAAFLVERLQGCFRFMSFELSASSEAVIECRGRLKRFFPGPAIEVPLTRALAIGFFDELAAALHQLDGVSLSEAIPKLHKANSHADEIRDTVHPMFVTEMVTATLRAIGDTAEVKRFEKHVRDDVLWDNALLPWRRSPLWLLLRVSTQMWLGEAYKPFMITFMSRLIQQAVDSKLPSEHVHLMCAKVVRRLKKAEPSEDTEWLPSVQAAIMAAKTLLDSRWTFLQQLPKPLEIEDCPEFQHGATSESLQLTVDRLRQYLKQRGCEAAAVQSTAVDQCENFTRIQRHRTDLPDLPSSSSCCTTLRLWTSDVEYWVEHSLTIWKRNLFSAHRDRISLSDQIFLRFAGLMNRYKRAAVDLYIDYAEEYSTACLTLIEMWRVLDEMVLSDCPLLRRYDPGFSSKLFEPLLLRSHSELERLNKVKHYITHRRAEADYERFHIFTSFKEKNSFSVRFYDTSATHQKLQREIERHATVKQRLKIEELKQQQTMYRSLVEEAAKLDCEYVMSWNRWGEAEVHSNVCYKCALERQARNMDLDIYEWPLPTCATEAKAVVVELDMPSGLSEWRDLTFGLLVDTFSPQKGGTKKKEDTYGFQQVDSLQNFVITSGRRIQPRSTTKPWCVTHVRTVLVSTATRDNVCRNHGASYSTWDDKNGCFILGSEIEPDLQESCTFQLPPGPYRSLQFVVTRTNHTSNEAIARKSECPPTVDFQEFYSFCTLRAGHRLQMHNIARELVSLKLNFDRPETYLLIAQALWQAGPSTKDGLCYQSHLALKSDAFGRDLLRALELCLHSRKGSWQNAAAIRILSVICRRLLSLAAETSIQNRCLDLLGEIRATARLWLWDMSHRLRSTDQEQARRERGLQMLDVALICSETFDVDQDYLRPLFGVDSNVFTATKCAMHIQDLCPADDAALPPATRRLFQRWQRLMVTIEDELRNAITSCSNGLHDAVRELWDGYRSGKPWKVYEGSWLFTQTTAENGNRAADLHFDLLSGLLLVDGYPLSRLPRSYENHATYKRLFGKATFEVFPSTMPGMKFQACRKIHNSEVHFDMRSEELIVRVENHGRKFEVLPDTALTGQLPQTFIHDYIHWLDLATHQIELRPLEEAWTESLHHWKVVMTDGARIMRNNTLRLVDVQSSLAREIYALFAALEQKRHIHIFSAVTNNKVTVRLHRFNLDFELMPSPARMQSKQYRGMFVDEIQSVGTFTGLVNKLVLRDVDGSRMMIVPCGKAEFSRDGDHVRVQIDNGSHCQVQHYAYYVDTHLERIRGDGTLKSKLFQTYLHALTSHCIPDELTKRTGTEESLDLLRGAWTQSFPHFDKEDIHLLGKISRLTPRMVYYPVHLHVMHQIRWSSLPTLSQHYEFVERVSDIVQHVNSLGVFRSDAAALAKVDINITRALRDRMAARQAPFRVEGFGAAAHKRDFDVTYSPRDRFSSTERVARAVKIATLVNSWSTELRPSLGLEDIMSDWKHVGGFAPESKARLDLACDLDWLQHHTIRIPEHFGQLLMMLTRSHAALNRDKLLFFLSTLAFANDASEHLCNTLLAFATVPQLRILKFPRHPEFNLGDGRTPDRNRLRSIAQNELRGLDKCPESSLSQGHDESRLVFKNRQRNRYNISCTSKVDLFVSHLVSQWPTNRISRPPADIGTYVKLDNALAEAELLFRSWFRNRELHLFVEEVQVILTSLSTSPLQPTPYNYAVPPLSADFKSSYVSFDDFTARPPPAAPLTPPGLRPDVSVRPDTPGAQAKLRQFLASIRASQGCGYEQDYMRDLHDSLQAHEENGRYASDIATKSETVLRQHLQSCKANALAYRNSLQQCLLNGNKPSDHLAAAVGMVPRTSTMSLLGRLAGMAPGKLPTAWQECIVRFGQGLSAVQHAEKLYKCRQSQTDLKAELQHQAHSGWDPAARPDWLLFELECNVRIRAKQIQIAEEMISPRSGQNSLLQLNMGEGKSSVITPIVAAALADGTKLVRVVVLKQLSAQMHRILANSLGGILNRPVIQMPFSRSLELTVDHAAAIQPAYQACMRAGGVVLLQPEHIASFELMVHDSYLRRQSALANSLWSTRKWIRDSTRDILDESDEILSTRFELVYTTGSQRGLEFAPQRWQITQQVFSIFAELISDFAAQNRSAFILSTCCSGGFPCTRIVDEEAGRRFFRAVLRSICQRGIPGLPVSHLRASEKAALERYLSEPAAGVEVVKSVRKLLDIDEMRNTLLTLRGLFAFDVLLFSLQRKRWRVDYGLHPSRTQLAVPYRAKDIPDLRSEFSHPEVIIVLTCLSYYYVGLTDEQLEQCFETLAAQEDREDEYALWVRDAEALRPEFRTLAGVNWRDSSERSQNLLPCFRQAKSVVDFFLTKRIFPYQLREFPDKLAASGWNLAEKKKHPTTGFSGTCDSKHILPLSIKQENLPEQLHTNAAVLSYLLAPRNDVRLVESTIPGGVVGAELLLDKIVVAEPEIRVLIDVGAQILEWTNEETARTWLLRSPADVKAAVFFDSRDEIVVLDRHERVELLVTSSYANHLDSCVVYLDEVHTRGTDLKLPDSFRAAVTLSPGMTKDRLVQACMRMRKLEREQSVVLLVTPEVQKKILQFQKLSNFDTKVISMEEVLKWCISQTWDRTKGEFGRWAGQGLRYARHTAALAAKGLEPWDSADVEHHICEPDAKSLAQLYDVDPRAAIECSGSYAPGESGSRLVSLRASIDSKRLHFGIGVRHTATLDEEQERELSPEIEQQRSVELPPKMDPCRHQLHPDVRCLFTLGSLVSSSDAFRPAFELFETTSASRHLEKVWDARLIMTRDFERTVSTRKKDLRDFFLRPVHWIARHYQDGLTSFVLLSPYEVNEVLAFQWLSSSVSLHVYSARTSEYNAATDGLTFCTIKPSATAAADPGDDSLRVLRLQLNLYAGQTIFGSRAEYVFLCQFLGLLYSSPSADISASIDGHLPPTVRPLYDKLMANMCPFEKNPLSLLGSILSMRRDGKAFDKSHLGRLIHGELLGGNVLEESQHDIPSF